MDHQTTQVKQHYVDFLSDSRVWSRFISEIGFSTGDIIIADPFKAGTTFTQRVLDQILSNGEESKESLSDKSPWLDSSWGNHTAMLDTLAKQRKNQRRLMIKSHLPADFVPINPLAKYIFVGRNGKDLVCSFHNYLYNFNPETVAKINQLHQTFSGSAEKMVIPADSAEFFDLFLNTAGGLGLCEVLKLTQSWWNHKALPNVLLVHYSKLIGDFDNEVKRMAAFIGVDVASLNIEKIKQNCSFAFMKENADKFVPFNGEHMTDAKAFFHQGPERDSSKQISAAQIAAFDALASVQMQQDCAKWLETGDF